MSTTTPMRIFGYLGTLGVVLMFLAPNAIPTTLEVIEGHVVFADMAGYSECLAGIVGLAREKVMWFNDQILLDSLSMPLGRHVYVVQNGAPDPVEQALHRTGVYYSFVDPNGGVWNITEWSYQAKVQPNPTFPNFPSGGVHSTTTVQTYFTWTVAIQEPREDTENSWINPGQPNAHTHYNFVLIVDTCRFAPDPNNDGGYEEHDNCDDTSNGENIGYGHNDTLEVVDCGPLGEHDHETYKIDLYLGGEPNEVVVYEEGFSVKEEVVLGSTPEYGRESGTRIPLP